MNIDKKVIFLMLACVTGLLLFQSAEAAFALPSDGYVFQDEEPVTPPDSNRAIEIVGGENATPNEFPYQIALMGWTGTEYVQFCGGSIIHQRWVMSAAHCLENNGVTLNTSVIKVRAGEHNLATTGRTEQEAFVNRIIVHPNYEADGFKNDIALLELTAPLTLIDGEVEIVKLNQDPGIAEGTSVTVTGWGALAFQGDSPDVLQKLTYPVVSNSDCADAYRTVGNADINGDMICAGLLGTGGQDSCSGDSGGPLTMPDSSGDWKQVGIVSFGVNCATAEYPGVYARVSSFIPWIEQYATVRLAVTNDIYMPFVFRPTPDPKVGIAQFAYSTTSCSIAPTNYAPGPLTVPSNVKRLQVQVPVEFAEGQPYSYQWLQNGTAVVSDNGTIGNNSFTFSGWIQTTFCANLPSATYTFVFFLDGVEQARSSVVVRSSRSGDLNLELDEVEIIGK